MSSQCSRRTFIKASGALFASGLFFDAFGNAAPLMGQPRSKKPALVRGAFFYPPAEVVRAGECEDNWSKHNWFTWPGNQFQPEAQQAEFMARLKEIVTPLDIDLDMDAKALYKDAQVAAFIEQIAAEKPEALLLFDFWNSFGGKITPILDAFDGPIILYHPVGANHQLPPQRFRTEKGLQYIHGISHYEALERGLRSVHAMNRMRQSKLLRVEPGLNAATSEVEPLFATAIEAVPAAEFEAAFDAMVLTPEAHEVARQVERNAQWIKELEPEAFEDAMRAHQTVLAMLDQHEADAITIGCLFLKHRKPCLSFALNNGALVPCGCENDLNATLTLMLGANLFGRGGFQHNPEFDLEENRYFGSHCTCLTKLEGPEGPDAPYALRPFFHQDPKTLALDVIWPEGKRTTMCKYHSGENRLDAWVGDIVGSPTSPPTGGCATRLLARFDDVEDVCEVYPGPHPVAYAGDFGRQLKTFAQLYQLELRGNC